MPTVAEALAFAREDHPCAQNVTKALTGIRYRHREGHFDADQRRPGVVLDASNSSPWPLLANARAVDTVTSQAEFEAIMAGHRPVTFGVPFYAGWGLTDDRRETPGSRRRTLARTHLVAAALILYPTWYDPYRDRLGQVEDVLDALEAQVRAWREDRTGWTAVDI